MWLRFSTSKDLLLCFLRQSNIAMAVSVNVHEHHTADEESIFMDAGIAMLSYSWEGKDSLTQFVMEFLDRKSVV